MTSSGYNIISFVERVKDKDYEDIILEASEELVSAEGIARRNRRLRRTTGHPVFEYERLLRGLLFFIRSGRVPDGVTTAELKLFDPVYESLVGRGQWRDFRS